MTVTAGGVVGRYAPSPTGPLHLGNLRTALICWLQARLAGGRHLLRMDDLDQPRNKPGSAESIINDLRWLGLDWDGEIIVQTGRRHVYQDAFDRLLAAGRIYPCRCSRRDIAAAQDTPGPRAREQRYPGTCRPENLSAPIHPGEPVAWRFRVQDEPLDWCDQIYGRQLDNLARHPGDFVVRRKDGIIAYQLASTVDDALCEVTDVVRGADLVHSTARQIALFRALGYPEPRFWHVPLLADDSGEKLSKRHGADSLDVLRRQGLDAGDVIGMLAATLGFCPAGSRLTAAELAAQLVDGHHDLATQLHRCLNH
jgi:glutamyl-tRNA synthetase